MAANIPLPKFPGKSATGGLVLGVLVILTIAAVASRQMPAPAQATTR